MGVYKNPIEFVPNSSKLTFVKKVTEWEELMGLPNEVILQRLKRGWGVERSITTPLLKGKNKINGHSIV